jgi:probable pyridine nucleotide-disulfide oxidoreductase
MVAAHRKMFADSAMNFISGTARFIAPRTVEIKTHNGDARLLRRTDVVINTGTTPALPDLPGVAESAIWTSETILQLERLPHRLLILGGGYVGCEFASMYALFGTKVILLQGRNHCCRAKIPKSPRRWPTSLLIKELTYDWVRAPRLPVATVTVGSW